jgi:D-aspartate ligase
MRANDFPNLVRLKRRLPEPGGPPGAVVIGGDYQGLGIARSLGSQGVPVCIVDDETSIARFSRHTMANIRVPDLRDEQSALTNLLRVGRELDLKGWVLFPTRDELVATLSRHRDVLKEIYRVPTSQWDTIKWIWDKRNTYKLAEELKIPVPRTWYPQSIEDVEAIDGPFPLALKPAIKEHFFYATQSKAWRANSKDELRDMYAKASAVAGSGEILIQDIIPGDGSHQFAYCAFFKDGAAVSKLVVRRRRQHPHDFGRSSTYVESIDMPALESLSERFLRPINYYGLVEVEFKLDPRDGQFKLLDVNGRTWGYHSIGAAAGVDFSYQLYRDQIGESVEPCIGRVGVTWVRLMTDIPTGVIDVFHGRLGPGDYLRSVWNAQSDAVFSWEDPLPGLAECALLPYLMIKRGF